MAFTQNQISDYVQSAVGRPATDYEYKTYMNASPQTLANLPSYYKSLNKDASIVDYLKYTGQDPESRTELAKKYNVPNIGTAEGNKALLDILRTGQEPQKQTITGTVIPTEQTTQTQPTVTQDTTQITTPGDTTTYQTDTSQTLTQPESRSPETTAALEQYKSVQTQIADIDKAINDSLANKRQQIIASGGIVDEAQLKSTVLAEQAPDRKSVV